MNIRIKTFLAAAALTLLLGACADQPLNTVVEAVASDAEPITAVANVGQGLPDRYIVVFHHGVANGRAIAAQMVRAARGELHFTYEHALNGFAATLPAPAVANLQRNPNIAFIEQDTVVTRASTTQSNATWGLDRIDQPTRPLNSTYVYTQTGAGVRAYVIDTGIHANHAEFQGRLLPGYTAIDDGGGTNDCDGHGTHVAGTIGGSTYGVAKAVSLVPVRVLNCSGSGTVTGVIAGVDWVTGQKNANPNVPMVANMSLGGSASDSLDEAVANSVLAGVVQVVAAGNDNSNACNYSPARAPSALTIGATTSTDSRARYSNFGTCVDLFAPGSSITSAWITHNTSTNTISGTSMAAPHVAGVAALILEQTPTATPADISATIINASVTGLISRIGTGSPNHLLQSQIVLATPGDGGGTTPPPTGDTTAPTITTFTLARSNAGPWRNVDVSWVVADETALASLRLEGRASTGTLLASAEISLDGLNGSGTTRLRHRSDLATVVLVVTDAAGNTATQTQP